MALASLLVTGWALRCSPNAAPVRDTLTAKRFWLLCFRRIENGTEFASAGMPSDAIRVPLLFMLLASFNFGQLALVFQFAETAVAAAMFDTWPAFALYLLAWVNLANTEYRCSLDAPPQTNTSEHAEHAALFLLAVGGLLLVFLSLSEGIGGADGIAGPLRLIAPVVAFLDVTGFIVCFRLIYFHTLVDDIDPLDHDQDRLPYVWETLIIMTISRGMSVSVLFMWGIVIDTGGVGIMSADVPGWPGWPMIGAVAVCVLVCAAILVRRLSSFLAAGRGINALGYLSPILAVSVLAVSGFDVHRFDLFVVGVLLMLTGNMLTLPERPSRPIGAAVSAV